jgi:hypothetical protein
MPTHEQDRAALRRVTDVICHCLYEVARRVGWHIESTGEGGADTTYKSLRH